jgi:cytoskeletal protein CcmA (bactofilin family)
VLQNWEVKTERGKIESPLLVEDDFALYGMAVKGVTVRPGGLLRMYGTVVGDVVVEREARAEIDGTVHGDLINRGGTVNLRGTLRGRVRTEGGTTNVDPNAVVVEP